MTTHVLHGRPEGEPDCEPPRLAIDPGSASAEEIAEILSAISKLCMLMGGRPIVWKRHCACPCHTGEQGLIMHDEPCCSAYDRSP